MRQHNALAPAAIEQQQLFIIHHAYGVIVHFKNVVPPTQQTFSFKNIVRQHNALAPAAIEQQITNHYSSSLWNDSSF